MAVKVEYPEGTDTIYSNATNWEIDSDDNLVVYNNENEVGLHAKEFFRSVRLIDVDDSSQLLEEAKELIQTVDDNDWDGQTDEWQERAQAFVDKI